MERDTIGLFIHSYLSESPVKELSHEMGENVWSQLSLEPHTAGGPIYTGVWPGSPRGLFTTLLLLPNAKQPSAQYVLLGLGRPEPC